MHKGDKKQPNSIFMGEEIKDLVFFPISNTTNDYRHFIFYIRSRMNHSQEVTIKNHENELTLIKFISSGELRDEESMET